ncbi:hypothetical protein [Spongiimicrobium salis]|uniref:hypothetical protein n=1 Tax=Spongiimicrobium salis TaxID=1667022 RepID=UPI00374D7794
MKKRKSLSKKKMSQFSPFTLENTEHIGGGAFNAGNAAGDLNPNDIESVTVLPSANAAALHGNRKSN